MTIDEANNLALVGKKYFLNKRANFNKQEWTINGISSTSLSQNDYTVRVKLISHSSEGSKEHTNDFLEFLLSATIHI